MMAVGVLKPGAIEREVLPEPGVPEGFKVLIKELQSLGLDVKFLEERS